MLGLNFIQSLVMPAFDSLKNGWATRVTSAVPGVGDAMGTAMQHGYRLGGSHKTVSGAAGLIVLAFLSLIPAVKLAVIVLMYQAAQAIVQPVGRQAYADLSSLCGGGGFINFKSSGNGIYSVFRINGNDDGGIGCSFWLIIRRCSGGEKRHGDFSGMDSKCLFFRAFLLLMTMAGQLIPDENEEVYSSYDGAFINPCHIIAVYLAYET
ncbi:MAG: hypothetical protein V8R85_10825 [Frisingicoccus sp.]